MRPCIIIGYIIFPVDDIILMDTLQLVDKKSAFSYPNLLRTRSEYNVGDHIALKTLNILLCRCMVGYDPGDPTALKI